MSSHLYRWLHINTYTYRNNLRNVIWYTIWAAFFVTLYVCMQSIINITLFIIIFLLYIFTVFINIVQFRMKIKMWIKSMIVLSFLKCKLNTDTSSPIKEYCVIIWAGELALNDYLRAIPICELFNICIFCLSHIASLVYCQVSSKWF